MMILRSALPLAFILMLLSPSSSAASPGTYWVELQDGWRVEQRDGLPSPGTSGDGGASFFEALAGGQAITISRALSRPRAAGDFLLYLKCPAAVEAYLNGTMLGETVLAPGEKTFEIPRSLWADTNTLKFVIAANPRARVTPLTPALFLTNVGGIARLRDGTIKVDAESLRSGNSVDMSGPVFLMKLEDEEYSAFTQFPAKTRFARGRYYTVTAPSSADHILKTLGHRRLMYEFFLEFTGSLNMPLTIRMDSVRGPDELYVDGVLIGKTGSIGDQSRLYYDRTRLYTLPESVTSPGVPHRVSIVTSPPTDTLTGSIDGPAFTIGSVESQTRIFAGVEVIAVAIAAIYFIVGLYYGLLWMRRIAYWEYLFFAMASISLAIYFFLRTQAKYLFFDDFFQLKRLEYIILFLLVPSMALFMHFFFKPRSTVTEKLFRAIFYLYLPVGLMTILFPVFVPDINTWNRLLLPFQITWAVPMLYIIFLITREALYFLVKKTVQPLGAGRSDRLFGAAERFLSAARRPWQWLAGTLPPRIARAVMIAPEPFDRQVRDTDAEGALMITAVFIMLAATVHDILLENNIITGTRLTSYGTLLFVLGIAVILTGRIFRLYARVGELNRGLNEAVSISEKHAGHLKEIIHGVDEASRDLVAISEQLSDIGNTFASMSENEARGSSELNATFHELTASTERISASADHQADEGGKTTALVETFNETQKGATQMIDYVLRHIADITRSKNDTVRLFNDMIGKMRIINEGGAQINSFVEIINDITDKINLLSLNASIEAARAGEHGRGFAVVADEISKLAAATSDNSREISSQINIILNDIREGMGVADITKKSTDTIFGLLDEINSRIDSVEGLIRRQSDAFANVISQAGVINRHAVEIAALAADQKQSMAQSGDTVEGLSRMANQIASSSGEILSLTESINEKTKKLQGLIREID